MTRRSVEPGGSSLPISLEHHERRIEWTGERCVPWADDIQVIYEHYQRYLFARPLASGRRVLDLASGEGYGSAILAESATTVLGIELDEDAVLHAAATYMGANLSFRQGDMLDLSALDDDAFDLVVCYEALEHVADHERLLTGICRVLAPGGVFVVSTPDRLAYNEGQHEPNPFHVHELTRDELTQLLDRRFARVEMWGQNIAVGSLMLALDVQKNRDGNVATLERIDERWSAGGPPNMTYYVAVASNSQLPELPGMFTLVDPGLALVRGAMRDHDALVNALDDALGNLQRAEYEIGRRTAQEVILRGRIETEKAEEQRLTTDLGAAAARIAELERERDIAQSALSTPGAGTSARPAGSFSAFATRLARVGAQRWATRTGSAARDDFAHGSAKSQLTVAELESSSLAERDHGPLPSFAVADSPRVSIVIPVYGQWQTTVRCLWAIATDSPSCSYEIIVVDDASLDDTPQVLAKIDGLILLRLHENKGFVHAVNAGAARARGEFIVLLNNDTEIWEGWLDALVKTAESDPDIGVVGARLLYPDGRLQEAGNIIFGDGSGWNYGHGDEPGHPSFSFVRDVDYCSGACLLVRRALWESLGGFDTRFAPAYYEDADLAFSARAAGYRVVYEPRAIAFHREGVTYGTDESPRKSALMVAHREAFREKWRDELAKRPLNDGMSVRTSSWRRPAGHVLVVDHMVPTRNQDAGSLRMYELLKILIDLGYAVTFIPFNSANAEPYTSELQDLGVEVLHGPVDIAHVIEQLAPDLRFALLSRPKVAWSVVPILRELAPKAKILYDTVDLHFLRERRRAELEHDDEAARLAEHFHGMETWLARATDAVAVVSETERAVLLREVPDANVIVIPTIHRRQHPGPGFDERQGLLFVGGFHHPPNVDAARWLVEEILPLVRKSLPDVPTSITGSQPSESIKGLSGPGVEVLGWVEDLRPIYARSRVFVAPLRYGAGVRGKIGESTSFGLPVVSTSLGTEGLMLEPGRDILVADSAEQIARAIVRLHQDPVLWKRIAQNGREAIAVHHTPTSVRTAIAQFFGCGSPGVTEIKRLPG